MAVNIKEVTLPLFVDDLAVYCTGYDAASTCLYLQRYVNSIIQLLIELMKIDLNFCL